jgi:hypothetical protein
MPVAKAYAKASAQIEADRPYSVEEAVDLAKRVGHAKRRDRRLRCTA